MSTTVSRAQPAVAEFVRAQLYALSGGVRELERGELREHHALEHHADEPLDCAIGPTDAWPEEWLG